MDDRYSYLKLRKFGFPDMGKSKTIKFFLNM